jgi:hypothetical protein
MKHCCAHPTNMTMSNPRAGVVILQNKAHTVPPCSQSRHEKAWQVHEFNTGFSGYLSLDARPARQRSIHWFSNPPVEGELS